MGRARVILKRISNERSRKTTFMQRKKGLIKKLSEISSMFGIEACLIVYDDENGGDVEPETWPHDSTVVRSIIQKHYELQLKNELPHNKFDIEDFFENKKNKVAAEICKVHKEITSIKYPTWDQNMRNLEKEQLKAFIAHVDDKIKACDHRINMLKNKQQSKANLSFMQNMVQTVASSSHQSQIISNPMEPFNKKNSKRVDFSSSINQVDGAFNHGINNSLINMQQGDAWFSSVPKMTQENANATSSHPSQVISLQNISQTQPILEALKLINDQNDVLDFTSELGQSMDWANQMGDLDDWFDGPIDL